jgi:hypothetical protein
MKTVSAVLGLLARYCDRVKILVNCGMESREDGR